MRGAEAGTPAQLVAALREDGGMPPDDLAAQLRYEHWLVRRDWQLPDEALPLLIGIDPAAWSAWRNTPARAAACAALERQLSDELDAAARVSPARLGRWAQRHAIALPPAFARLLDFIDSVMSATPAGAAPAAAAERAERELLLGAALSLVTRFPDQCRDANGFFDEGLIADRILEKAALWFPLEPPRRSREDIVALLAPYVS